MLLLTKPDIWVSLLTGEGEEEIASTCCNADHLWLNKKLLTRGFAMVKRLKAQSFCSPAFVSKSGNKVISGKLATLMTLCKAPGWGDTFRGPVLMSNKGTSPRCEIQRLQVSKVRIPNTTVQ